MLFSLTTKSYTILTVEETILKAYGEAARGNNEYFDAIRYKKRTERQTNICKRYTSCSQRPTVLRIGC
jgi:hypothetical protein